MNDFTRKISFHPAFDKRNSEPSKNYGIHGLEMCFTLIGAEGGVSFHIYTNWHLPHVQEELDSKVPDDYYPYLMHSPQPAGVEGHWRVPQYEGQTPVKGCSVAGGDCYRDGSGLLATEFFNILVTEGEEAVWKALEKRYEDWKPK